MIQLTFNCPEKYDGDELVAVSLGSIMHWCTGTEYLFMSFLPHVKDSKGLGKEFIKDIIEYVKKMDVNHIFLQTERELPAYSFYQKLGFKELEGHASLVKRFD